MARPAKPSHLRMDTDLRIPVTVEQKNRIIAAIGDDPGGLAAWAREVLLRAAEARIAGTKPQKAGRKRSES